MEIWVQIPALPLIYYMICEQMIYFRPTPFLVAHVPVIYEKPRSIPELQTPSPISQSITKLCQFYLLKIFQMHAFLIAVILVCLIISLTINWTPSTYIDSSTHLIGDALFTFYSHLPSPQNNLQKNTNLTKPLP